MEAVVVPFLLAQARLAALLFLCFSGTMRSISSFSFVAKYKQGCPDAIVLLSFRPLSGAYVLCGMPTAVNTVHWEARAFPIRERPRRGTAKVV